MSEKILKTRLVNKHDVQSNWEKAENFVPMKGELIVYDVDENYSYERFKIGDGVTNVNDLKFYAGSWEDLADKPVEETDDDAMEMLAEMGILDPVTDEENNILTDENGNILTI